MLLHGFDELATREKAVKLLKNALRNGGEHIKGNVNRKSVHTSISY